MHGFLVNKDLSTPQPISGTPKFGTHVDGRLRRQAVSQLLSTVGRDLQASELSAALEGSGAVIGRTCCCSIAPVASKATDRRRSRRAAADLGCVGPGLAPLQQEPLAAWGLLRRSAPLCCAARHGPLSILLCFFCFGLALAEKGGHPSLLGLLRHRHVPHCTAGVGVLRGQL